MNVAMPPHQRVRVLVLALYALPYGAATYRGLARVTGMVGRTLIRAISEATSENFISFQRGFDGRRQVSLTPLGIASIECAWKKDVRRGQPTA